MTRAWTDGLRLSPSWLPTDPTPPRPRASPPVRSSSSELGGEHRPLWSLHFDVIVTGARNAMVAPSGAAGHGFELPLAGARRLLQRTLIDLCTSVPHLSNEGICSHCTQATADDQSFEWRCRFRVLAADTQSIAAPCRNLRCLSGVYEERPETRFRVLRCKLDHAGVIAAPCGSPPACPYIKNPLAKLTLSETATSFELVTLPVSIVLSLCGGEFHPVRVLRCAGLQPA
jgi:hypothetical protein